MLRASIVKKRGTELIKSGSPHGIKRTYSQDFTHATPSSFKPFGGIDIVQSTEAWQMNRGDNSANPAEATLHLNLNSNKTTIDYKDYVAQLKSQQDREARNEQLTAHAYNNNAQQEVITVDYPATSPNWCLADNCNHKSGEIADPSFEVAQTKTIPVEQTWNTYYKRNFAAKFPTTVAVTATVTTVATTATVARGTPVTTHSNTYSSCTTVFSSPSQLAGQQRLYTMSSDPQIPLDLQRRPVGSTVQNAQSATPPEVPCEVDQPDNLKPVYKMLQYMTGLITDGNSEMRQLRQEVQGYNDTLSDLHEELNEQAETICAVAEEVSSHDNDFALSKVLFQKNSEELDHMRQRMDRLEADKKKYNILIFGIEEKESEDLTKLIQDFFLLKMEISDTITLSNVFRRGTGKARPIVVQLAKLADKGKIYKHAKNLKGKTNSNERSYQVRDNLPENAREEDKKHRDIMNRFKNNTAIKIKRSLKQRQLLINNSVYKNKAKLPSDMQMLSMTKEERNEVQQCSLFSADKYLERDSTFLTYAANVATHQQIRAIQCHLRLKHPECTCIVTAFKIGGEHPDCADYDDNGEYGAGTRLFQLINQHKLENAAVFVVRYHSGANLGPRHFEIYKEQAEVVINLLVNEEPMVSHITPHKTGMFDKLQNRTRGRIMGMRGASHNVRNQSRGMRRGEISPSTTANRGRSYASVVSPNQYQVLAKMGQDESDPEIVLQPRK